MREIPPEIIYLNQQLLNRYGKFENGEPNYRVVWSEDQFEYRLGLYPKFDAHGNYLGESQDETFQYVPKYRQWMSNQWVLEKILPVPEISNKELTGKISYEPLHGFIVNGKGITPSLDAVCFLISLIQKQLDSKHGTSNYRDPLFDENDAKIGPEVKKAKIDKLVEELFGNESSIGDSLAHKEAIISPGVN